jgi:RNA polymerase sigma-70 factor (ECF subfamily)
MTAALSRRDRDQAWMEYIRRCAAGDQSALSALYDESSHYVYGMALRILRDAADAEEITIDVYSQAWKSAGSFSPDRGTVLSWLVTLTRSRAIDRSRTRAARSRRLEESIDTHFVLTAGADNPEEATALTEERNRIRQALSQLSPEQRELLELAYFSGLSHSELALRAGQPLGTVKTRIRLGMMKLREILGHL